MNGKLPFGRRGRPAKISAPSARAPNLAPSLTPAQRALLFEAGEAPAVETAAISSTEIAPWSRPAALVASLAVTGVVAAFALAGESREPLELAGSILSVGSNLAANLWLTQKFCALARLHGFAAFALTGALLGLGLSFAAARIGLGDTELGYEVDALSGAGAALLYRLLAGRQSVCKRSGTRFA
ncbi:hypothetical protein [uncultured Rhodoblastus sp.]|uniref:hypothetical protein n=1 Tax=uncultured Rhodoblastus sp. TaxID=543037 RepID=UPI0025CE9CE6|nr:hypothetical protein [uncultured Rhodoblastus sp.]